MEFENNSVEINNNNLNLIEKIIEDKIRLLLNIINKNYSSKFKKEYIDKEIEYIKTHILFKPYIKKIILPPKKFLKLKYKPKIKTKHIKNINKNININKHINTKEHMCCARVWNDDIFERTTMNKVKDIKKIFKVIDFKDINIEEFNKTYIIGLQCKKKKYKNNNYCSLHSKHLIHGNYTEKPSKELCYHFMKDGKYL